MISLRASLAAIAVAAASLSAGTASAKPANVQIGPNKLILKLCRPHFETNSQYVGIRKIGFRFYRVYRVTTVHVHVNCFKHVVRVSYRYVPLPIFYKKGVPGV